MHAGLFCHSWRSGNYGDFVAKINMGAAHGIDGNMELLGSPDSLDSVLSNNKNNLDTTRTIIFLL